MTWALGWKRPSEIFHLVLSYGSENPAKCIDRTTTSSRSSASSSLSYSTSSILSQKQEIGFRIELDWSAAENEDQVALKLQSQLMVALPMPQDCVLVELRAEDIERVILDMKVMRRRDPLRAITMTKTVNTGQQTDGAGVLTRLLSSNLASLMPAVEEGVHGCGDHWRSVSLLSICACGLSVLPVELIQLPHLEKLYLNNNRLSVLPPELGELRSLKVLRVDNNMLSSVPVELRQCDQLVELSLEHNKLVRPLLDLRAMTELRVLRLFGNPLEFLPEILTLHKLCHLSLANVRIVADENLRSVNVQIEMENSSYFVASRHKLSAFFSLIFRFSFCHHPLLASALAKIMRDQGNKAVVGKDENAVRQLISMISSDNQHVVERACCALSALSSDVSVALQLVKADIMQPIETVLKSLCREEVISVLKLVVTLAFTSDAVAEKMLSKDVLKSLKLLCAHKDPEVQRLALLAVGNLAFCLENRHILVTSESLRELLLHLTVAAEPCVNKAAARALAILGENENLQRAIRGRQVPKQGLRILSMDGGGMKGLATVQILKEIEKGTGKRIHELFDLICGTSTGGMLAVALGIKLMTLEKCEDIYKNLGKIVFAEPVPKDSEAASWREKLDQLYKSSSKNFRVVVHGSKHSADQFERLLREMCTDEDGDLMIDSAVKNVPKVFIASTLVSVTPAQPFVFRNYQYPAGTPEVSLVNSESSVISELSSPTIGAQVGNKRSAFFGSCKHQLWQAIRASSAAPYYLDDFSDDVNRWQDGAIVANNPTIFAIREAQLLWPDTKIDCLVSIGCGSVPTRMRKGGWRYLDTGQVLIESACSVDRVDEALTTLLPMLPEMQYFRFNPADERCDMELDETDPTIWLKLESAVDEYIQKNHQALESVCEKLLLPFQHEENWLENIKYKQPKTKDSIEGASGPTLGWRRNVLLVEASHNPDSGREIRHAQALDSFCAHNGIRLSRMQGLSRTVKAVPATAFPTPVASPMFTGSFPSTPHVYSPDFGQRIGRIDLIPPLSLDAQLGKTTASPPVSPRGLRQLPLPVQLLHEKLQNSPQVGVIHLALQNDLDGLIMSWHNDVFVVAELGELAEKFLQSVKVSLLSSMKSRRRKCASLLANISTVSELVAAKPYFQIGGILHRFVGRQTLVMEDDYEVGSYLFRRTVPSLHLTPDDVRQMVGAWRDRIIICTGLHGPSAALIKAFLDSGAKAVVCSSNEPPEPLLTHFDGSREMNALENGKFEIGEDEMEDEHELESPSSDWEDSDAEKLEEQTTYIYDDNEEELSQFVCQLYESLFREGAGIKVALEQALASHRRLGYVCHLSSI
ncbi:LOW QUALITY PROTEIN: phospholipase A I-like [Neltuma alba]|uniref:LOW QUALITY PROTEIN: phospholipase A I-like n=1 Tax=Neltuma alba TaxID=207710 RepID=UPI0010A5072F|nr:LOW QUALITY PROTEIN: phospholipase A I-like [Prosopis alba]